MFVKDISWYLWIFCSLLGILQKVWWSSLVVRPFVLFSLWILATLPHTQTNLPWYKPFSSWFSPVHLVLCRVSLSYGRLYSGPEHKPTARPWKMLNIISECQKIFPHTSVWLSGRFLVVLEGENGEKGRRSSFYPFPTLICKQRCDTVSAASYNAGSHPRSQRNFLENTAGGARANVEVNCKSHGYTNIVHSFISHCTLYFWHMCVKNGEDITLCIL